MISRLVEFSLRNRLVIIVLGCVLVVYGAQVALHAKLDVFPNFVQPQVVVQTEAPGFAPEQVEALVTVPIETAINGLGEMESLRSESIEGLSIITTVFKEGTDVFRSRQMLAERLSELGGSLPASVNAPRLTPLTSSTMDLLKIGLVSDTLSPMELRTFADWTLKPRLLAVPGVAKCSTFGGQVRQIQIQIVPEKLLAHGLTFSEVLQVARLSTGVVGGGFIETSNQRITVQTEGQSVDPGALGQTPIFSTNGVSVRLNEIANVVEAPEPKVGDTLIQGKAGVLLTMSSQYGANTMEVTRDLESALKEFDPVFEQQKIKLYPRLHRPATFIEAALKNIAHSLGLGALLVAVVLLVLLGSVRTALISLTAIPLSLLGAVVLLDRFGMTLNTITLGGLAIALGEVVDDSIIDVENIFRRLREHLTGVQAGLSSVAGNSVFDVVLRASLEVRRAVVYATFTVALVFLPVLTLTGLQGSFFAPLALSYILAILCSLVVALTLTPALAYTLFSRGAKRPGDPQIQRVLKSAYLSVLRVALRFPRILIAVLAIATIVAAIRLPFLGGSFLPEFREGHLVLQVSALPGTSLPEMLRIGHNISDELLKNSDIDTIEQQIGRAELGEDAWGPNRCEFHVELKPVSGERQGKVAEDIRKLLSSFPGIQFEVLTFLGDRISETLTGETAPVVVSIFGENLDLLDSKAKEVASVLARVPGSADVQVKSPPGSPRLVVRLRQDRLAQFGYRPMEVLEAIQAAYRGIIVAQAHRGRQVVDVAVILEERSRNDPGMVKTLLVRNASGLTLPLSELADIFTNSGRPSILHEGARRRQTVTCATSGRDLSAFVEDAKRQVAEKVVFPAASYAAFSGTAEARSAAQRELLLNSGIAAVGIFLLLAVVFRNARNLLLVLVNVPFAFVGGIAALWLTSQLGGVASGGLSIGSLVGFVTLFGITMRNSIMMISHFEHLVREEGMTWGLEAATRGASERLMPILMTATVTGLGLLPLALGSGEAGREIEGPMAIVILGGLISSTILNLLVLPTMALRYGKFARPA